MPSFLPCILPFESTVATPGFELLYLSSLFVAFAGEIIVSICVLSPTTKFFFDMLIFKPVTFTFVLFTAILICFLTFGFDTDVTSIFVFPVPTAFIFPFTSTVATDAFELEYLTALSVAFSGKTVGIT